MSDTVPERVACPCGTGSATHRLRQVSNPKANIRRRFVHHYRHEGCHGGAIVVDCGRIARRIGPLFQPDRYGRGKIAPAATERVLATDGGRPR